MPDQPTPAVLSQLPEVFTRPAYGNLVHLPDLLKAAKLRVSNARAVAQPLMTELASTNFRTVDLAVMEEKIKKAATIRARAANAETEINKSRSEYTTWFRDITTSFTTEEKALKAMGEGFANFQNEWEREKARRNKEEADRVKADLDKKNLEIELKAEQDRKDAAFVSEKVATLIATFNGMKWNELEAYGKKIQAWVPADQAGNYKAIMLQTVADLVKQIPGRIEALKTQAEAVALRDKQEAEQRQKQASAKAIEIQAQAEGAKIDAVMDITSVATPMAEAAKGVRKKQVYVLKSIADLNKIIHSYLVNDIPKMTLPAAVKTFKFAVTSANGRLNTGEVIEGIEIVEELKTVTASINE